MSIRELREKLGLSQEAFAGRLGLKSKGHVSDLESGKCLPSVAVALELERLSEGELSASALNADVALIAAHIQERAA